MTFSKKISSIVVIVAALLLGSCRTKNSGSDQLPYYVSADFTPHWIGPKEAATVHSIPDFSFTDQEGKKITLKTFDNQIAVVNFFFTRCPGICKKMTSGLENVQEEFLNDDNVLLLSHSVTPETDSVPVLAKYARTNDIISNKWHLVTGKQSEIYRIARQSYFADEDLGVQQDSSSFLHTENVLLIDKQHHIRGVYKGTIPSEIDNLIADIKKLEKEE